MLRPRRGSPKNTLASLQTTALVVLLQVNSTPAITAAFFVVASVCPSPRRLCHGFGVWQFKCLSHSQIESPEIVHEMIWIWWRRAKNLSKRECHDQDHDRHHIIKAITVTVSCVASWASTLATIHVARDRQIVVCNPFNSLMDWLNTSWRGSRDCPCLGGVLKDATKPCNVISCSGNCLVYRGTWPVDGNNNNNLASFFTGQSDQVTSSSSSSPASSVQVQVVGVQT